MSYSVHPVKYITRKGTLCTIIPYNTARYLRSMNNAQIEVPRVKSVSGTRSFSSAAPNIYNNLPLQLRTMHL